MKENSTHAEEAGDETYALPADASRKPMLGDWMTQGDKGMSAGNFPSITPKPSALRSVLTNMHVAAVATGMKKVWGKF